MLVLGQQAQSIAMNRSQPWGKLDQEAGDSHHLAHHCADVAASFMALARLEGRSLSSIMMPGDMDGLELAKLLHEGRPRLSVLLTSGSNQQVEEAQLYFTTLQKPYQISDLDRAIQVLLRARDDAADGNNLVDLNKAKRERGKVEKH